MLPVFYNNTKKKPQRKKHPGSGMLRDQDIGY